MNKVKTNPMGIDALIQRIQNKLYSELNVTWNLVNTVTPSDESKLLDAYGRCYLMLNDKGTKDVKYFVSGSEYNQISVAEKNKFFFLHNQKSEKVDNINYETILEAVFIVDLPSLKPNIPHRADVEVQADVELILNQFYSVTVKSIETGYENALRGVDYSYKNDKQPYHVFKYNLSVRYQMDDTRTCGT